MMANRQTVFRCSSDILVKDFGRWFSVFLQRAAVLLQRFDDLALPRGVGQLGTDGHVPKLGIQHLFLRIRQTVLLLDRLIACQDIQEHERDNEPDERILLSDSFAAEQISVQPTLYVVRIGHIILSFRLLSILRYGCAGCFPLPPRKPYAPSLVS